MVAVTLVATFTTPGVFTWWAPPSVASATVACTGGGGGGGAAAATTGDNGGGGGGGEGALEPAVGVTPGLGYTVTVGAGGAGGTNGGNGAVGSLSSFVGDSLTVTANPGRGGLFGTPTAGGSGGAGGTGSQNTISAQGGAGADGTPATNGGGGGSAAGTNLLGGFPGNPGNGSSGGAQVVTTWPGGAGAAGSTSGAGPGSNGSAPGGGGGGALSTGTGRAGGAGANGTVIVTYTMNDPVTLVNDTIGCVQTFQAPAGSTSVTAQAWGAGAGGFDVAPAGAGSSAFPNVYGSPRYSTALNTFDGAVSRKMAGAAQTVYYQEQEYPASGSGNDSQGVSDLVTKGGCTHILAVFKCSRQSVVTGGSTLTTEISNFAAGLTYLQSIPGIVLTVAVGNEPNCNGANGPFGDGSMKDWNGPNPYGTNVSKTQCIANWKAFCAAYAPTVATAGLPNAYKPFINGAGTLPVDMFPGNGSANGGCDLIMADWYGRDFTVNGLTPFGSTNVEGLADTYGMKLGLGEWGNSAGTAINPTDWATYISALVAGINSRKTAGKPLADFIYFAGLSTGGANYVSGTSDFKVPGLQQVADLLTSTTQKGGAGGGGGEFAQESSLAITGLSSYVIAVGNGGADLTSGTNSTIAGDSVTVTARGGSVATATTAGGAGGTGSSNTTHEPGGAGGAGGGVGGGGGGGGSSGGTAAGGNAGAAGGSSFGGAGGVAPTGGGPGGKGGGPNKSGAPPASGPGGGGSGRGATGTSNGTGQDGQITLSSFLTHPSASGSFALGPLSLSGTAGVPAGSFGLAGVHLAGSANVSFFNQVQLGAVASGTGSAAPVISASTPGTTLLCVTVTTGTTAVSLPSGWVQDVSKQQGAGGGGIISVWRYAPNPGGITGTTATGGGGDTIRAFILEVSTPANTTAVLSATPGTAGAAAPATSFPVSNGGANNGGDMALSVFIDRFTTSTAGSWTTPAGWTALRSQTSLTNWYASYVQYGLSAGTVSVTGTASTSTGQVGWGAFVVSYTTVPLVSTTGNFALGALGLSGIGSAVLGPGQVACSGGLALGGLSFQSPSEATTFPQAPLPIRVEILVNGAWTDISSFVYQRDNIQITSRGRPDEASQLTAAQCSMTLNNRDGRFTTGNPNGAYYPYLIRNTQLRISINNAVTQQGAWYTGYRFWGEVPGWPIQWDPSGTDVFCPIVAAGVTQRLAQSQQSGSPLRRYYNNIINMANTGTGNPALIPAAYWPCEDGTSATSFSSGLPGGSSMTWSGGTPGLQGASGVLGSDSFAETNGTTWAGIAGNFNQGGTIFPNPGTFQWTCPAGITSVKVECWGGGGGGANGFFSGGGGGGEYAAEPALAVTPGKTYTFTVGAGGAGGPGSFSKQGGSAGSKTTFAGDVKTVTAGGGSGSSSSGTGGSGGNISTNTTHFKGGKGANQGSGRGGSGGGGSGGNASAGNNGSSGPGGNSPGNGGTAVAGGGAGGLGGTGSASFQSNDGTPGFQPVPGPGGGGGGGGFNGGDDYGKPGGGGAPGQVQITFQTGQIPAPPAIVLRALVNIPSTGGVDQAYLAQLTSAGTVATLTIIYHTASSGSLELKGQAGGGSNVFDSATTAFPGINGTPMIVSAELTQTATNTVSWKLTAVAPGGTAPVATVKGTYSGVLGNVTNVDVNNHASFLDTGSGEGHITVQYAVDPILNLAAPLNGWAGELAAARFLRLCNEQNIPTLLTGNVTDTPQMGPQQDDLLFNLLQDCETADLGQLFEPRTQFGLGYITRAALQNQQAAAIVDYSLGQLASPLSPVNDERLVHNDVQVTLLNAGTYELQQLTGTLSVNNPPNGVGIYAYQVSVNLFQQSQLPGYTQWLLTLGTVDEYRYPVIAIDMARQEIQGSNFNAVAALDIGNFLQIVNPPVFLPPGPINQLCFGFKETLNAFLWTIEINAVPEDPYSTSNSTPNLPIW